MKSVMGYLKIVKSVSEILRGYLPPVKVFNDHLIFTLVGEIFCQTVVFSTESFYY